MLLDSLKRESHAFEPYIPAGVEQLIIGTFPISKFTDPSRRHAFNPEKDVWFPYGGSSNNLWRLIGDCFGTKLETVADITALLARERIGVIDVISSCVRQESSASDSNLGDIQFNERMGSVLQIPTLRRLLFTSRGAHAWFHRQPKWKVRAGIEEIILPSPSANSYRSLGRLPEFREWRRAHPSKPAYEFLLGKYRDVFESRAPDVNAPT